MFFSTLKKHLFLFLPALMAGTVSSSIENSWKNKMILRGADCPQSLFLVTGFQKRMQKARAKDVEEPVEKLTRS